MPSDLLLIILVFTKGILFMHSNLIAVLSFYSFTDILNTQKLMQQLLLMGKRKQLRGTILVAQEGVNGSISGSKLAVTELIEDLKVFIDTKDISVKINYCDEHPFQKFKVKLKQEIVALGVGELDVQNNSGVLVDSIDWDEFISQKDVVVIDTRNSYEIKDGTFKGAIDPNTETFKQFPKWVEENKELLKGKKIAMCCTGGIRCEKSTTYMKSLGFNEVYHLNGGILQYLADTQNKNDIWQGKCFVFDDRRAVDVDLSPAEGHWLQRS